MSRRMMAMAALTLLVGACGSGGGDDADTAADAPAETPAEAPAEEPAAEPAEEPAEEPAAEPAEEPAADQDVGDAESDAGSDQAEDAADGPEETAEETADDGPMTGDPDSEWCVAARRVEDSLAALDDPALDVTDPVAVEETFGRLLDSLDDAARIAPPELADDVATSIEGFRAIDEALAAAGYDFLLADLSAVEENDAEVSAAAERISAYNEDVCGIAAEPDVEDEAAIDLGAGSIRDQTIGGLVGLGFTEEEATCVFESLDFSGPDGPAMSQQQYFTVLADCGMSQERIMELTGVDG